MADAMPKNWVVRDGEPWYQRPAAPRPIRGAWGVCQECSRRFPHTRGPGRGVVCSHSCNGKRNGRLEYGVLGHSDLFAEWDEGAAWLAGLIWGDGCLAEHPLLVSGLHIYLVTTDREIADQAALIAGVNATGPYERGGRKDTWGVRIGRRDPIARLQSIGLTPRKSMTAPFPALPDEALPHFTRGVFDADGSAFHSAGVIRSNISGSLPFLEGLQSVLTERADIPRKRLYLNKSIWRLQLGQRDTGRLARFMYSQPGPHLPRKRAVMAPLLVHEVNHG